MLIQGGQIAQASVEGEWAITVPVLYIMAIRVVLVTFKPILYCLGLYSVVSITVKDGQPLHRVYCFNCFFR